MMKKVIQGVENVKESKASKVIQPTENSLLTFNLPQQTDSADDFIKDDIVDNTVTAGITGDGDLVSDINENNEAEKHRGTPDSKGNAYDPLIHAFPPEMTGKLQKWKKKPKAKIEQAIVEDVKSNTSYRSEADKFAKLYASLHMLPFGNDGALKDKTDIVPLTDDIERYMQENGHTNLSAGWSIAISAGLYSVGVCQREPNAIKVKRVLGGVWDKVKGIFKKKKKPVYDAKPDIHRPKAETSKPQIVPDTSKDNEYTTHGF